MCTCEYCGNDFIPRPQVKNPKACKNYQCQQKRQRQNEKDWKNRHIDLYDAHYYSDRREARLKWLRRKAEKVLEAIKTGFRFMGIEFNEKEIASKVALFFLNLGVRKINKLWIS